jgi:hypothetical protein
MSLTEFIPIIFIAITIIGAIVQISRERLRADNARIGEIFLNWAFLVIIGIGGIWGFIGHTLFADLVAESIGWPTGNPFQQEVALANLAIGVLGILALLIPGTFRIAPLIAYTIFMMGAGIGHIWQIISVHNLSESNAGPVLWLDLCMPVVLIGLYLLTEWLQKHKAQPSLRR